MAATNQTAPTAIPSTKMATSWAEVCPVASRPTPYALKATERAKQRESRKFQTANWRKFILAVPEMTAGVKKTARRPHFS